MTERIDDGDLDEMHMATALSDASGFTSIQCNVKTMLELLREVIESRAKAERSWIRCSERMPEEGRAVLFSNPLWAEPELGRFVDEGWELDDETRYTQDEVRFWHTLPAPPGDE